MNICSETIKLRTIFLGICRRLATKVSIRPRLETICYRIIKVELGYIIPYPVGGKNNQGVT